MYAPVVAVQSGVQVPGRRCAADRVGIQLVVVGPDVDHAVGDRGRGVRSRSPVAAVQSGVQVLGLPLQPVAAGRVEGIQLVVVGPDVDHAVGDRGRSSGWRRRWLAVQSGVQVPPALAQLR